MLELEANWNYAEADGRRHYLVKAKRGNRVIGRAHGWFAPQSRFVLEKIELDRRHRSLGYGTHMIHSLRAHARAQGCSHFVFAGVMNSNVGAIRLYESMDAVAGDANGDGREFVISPP